MPEQSRIHQPGEPAYVVVSPVRNEEKYVWHTLESMVRQTVRPSRWVIVNDGSTDQTRSIVEAVAKDHPWIELIEVKDRGYRKPGGGVVQTFNVGLEVLKDSPWDFIVKLDCDLSFEPDYFERLLEEFSKDERLGIASGVYLEKREGEGEWRLVSMPEYHAAGASKVVRRECFEEIEGFIAERGWDTVDEIRAIARGWRTTHFPDLKMKHWKLEGSGVGFLKTGIMHGEIYYKTGGGLLFFLCKVLHRMVQAPLVLGGVAVLWGYLRAMILRIPRLVTAEQGRAYRSLLNERLRKGVSGA